MAENTHTLKLLNIKVLFMTGYNRLEGTSDGKAEFLNLITEINTRLEPQKVLAREMGVALGAMDNP